jgi:membrane fusion protein (multidrug efflux system)
VTRPDTVLFLAVAVAATAAGCSDSPGDDDASPDTSARRTSVEANEPAQDVTVRTLEPREYRETLEVTGALQPWEEVEVSAELGGLVREIAFEKGQRIGEGQILARVGDDIARAQLEQAKAELVDAEARQRRAEQLFERSAIPEQELIAATSRRDAQRALVEERELRLERSILRAPISGVALDEPVDEGEVIPAGTRVTTIQRVDRLELQADVPDTEIGWLELGREATVAVDAYPDLRFDARVHFLSPAADRGSRTFTVELALDNSAGRLRPGMIARVSLLRRRVPAGLVVPLDTVLAHEDGQHVFVVQDGVAVERPVEIGGTEGRDALIASGLEAGDRLIVEGHRQIAAGQRVRAREAR